MLPGGALALRVPPDPVRIHVAEGAGLAELIVAPLDTPTLGASSGRAAEDDHLAPFPTGVVSVALRVLGGRQQVCSGWTQAKPAQSLGGTVKHDAEWPRASVRGVHSCEREAAAASRRPGGHAGPLGSWLRADSSPHLNKGTMRCLCPESQREPARGWWHHGRLRGQRRSSRPVEAVHTSALAALGTPCSPGVLCENPPCPGSSFQAGVTAQVGIPSASCV